MDGTPVYNMVRTNLPGVTVNGFAGALNSTTKVILGAMSRGLTLEQGMEEARRLGVTEAAPLFDIDGWDSACKAADLANVLMDARTTPQQVERRGIGKITPDRLAAISHTPSRNRQSDYLLVNSVVAFRWVFSRPARGRPIAALRSRCVLSASRPD